MATQFERLFTPIQLRHKTIKNRIVLPCHSNRFPFFPDETDGSQYIEYERARAKGGCGLMIVGPNHVHKASTGVSDVVPPTPEILAPKVRRLADAIHEHGAVAIMQLYHRGNSYESTENNHALWGFSPCPSKDTRHEVCHEMDEGEIQEIIEGYVQFAVLAKENGLDGVEYHCAHAALPYQSYTPYYNQRTDRWGEQMAFVTECLKRIRAAVGYDFIVGTRIPSDDFQPGGMDNEAMKKVAQAMEATGLLDYINTTEGSQGSHYAWIIGSMYVRPGAWVPLTSGIKQVVKSLPVIATGRINDPSLAESVLADGHADMVGMCRALIADPELPNKARQGRVDDIRLCIACNQGCADKLFSRMQLSCLQNAAVGKEAEIGTIQPAQKKKKVVVIGGGPGGMEAARVAALRGHDVILYEKENQLGGQVNTLVKAPDRDEFGQATRYLATQINKLGVKVKLVTEATVDKVKQDKPDAVIVATGSTPCISALPGSTQENVVTPSQVLDEEVSVGERVLVYDTTGLQEAITVADFLADRGKKVEIVTPFPTIGQHLGPTHVPLIWPRLLGKGIIFTVFTALKKIDGRSVTVSHVYTEDERSIDTDTVVMCTGYRAQDKLYRALKGQFKEVYAVGDCNSPRRVIDAIHEAYNTTFKI